VQWARRGLSALGLAIGHCGGASAKCLCVVFNGRAVVVVVGVGVGGGGARDRDDGSGRTDCGGGGSTVTRKTAAADAAEHERRENARETVARGVRAKVDFLPLLSSAVHRKPTLHY